MIQYYIDKVWVDDEQIYARATDGKVANYAFSQWPRLAKATPEQRRTFEIVHDGIYWPLVDEDLSFQGMFADCGFCDKMAPEESVVYRKPFGTDDNNLLQVAEAAAPFGNS